VLFVPPTLVNPDEAFFTFERGFDAMGIPYCALTVPDYTTEDIQVSAEYVVNAVRTLHAQSGGKVDIVGWSQGGGPEPRWALRFWPDIRPMVDDLVDIEAPNHGTVVLHTTCGGGPGTCVNMMCDGSCPPALWQQADNSQFTAALNSGQETFPGISYTNIYSHTSQFVQPNLDDTGSTSLHGGGGEIANVATQDICPADTADHMAYYYDPVGWALIVDALTHAGPASVARIDPAVCTEGTMPYVSAAEVPTQTINAYNELFINRKASVPQTNAEPALKCYVTASCPVPALPVAPTASRKPAKASAGKAKKASHRSHRRHRRHHRRR
jgi:triacylglycerol esterase/lipase EstA (alpha/beta hydrolase family)